MKKVYERIIDLRGNLITVAAKDVSLGELARIHKKNGQSLYASVLRIEGEKVTLQAFENTRGIATNDRVSFLSRDMQAICSDELFGRRLDGTGTPNTGTIVFAANIPGKCAAPPAPAIIAFMPFLYAFSA